MYIRAHPTLGGGPRIIGTADIDDRQLPVAHFPDVLPYVSVIFGEAKVEGFDFADGMTQRNLENIQVEFAANLKILAYVIDRAIGVKLLGIPDTKLSSRQFTRFMLRSEHA
jgi:hypothetical protein